jgi:hypothetical protein
MRFDLYKIFVPTGIHVTIVRSKSHNLVYFYNEYYYFCLQIANIKSNIFFNELNTLVVRTAPTIYNATFKVQADLLLLSLNIYLFQKFKLKGKGFRIYRRSASRFVKFFLGASHLKIIKFTNFYLTKISKAKVMAASTSFNNIKKLIFLSQKIRPLGIYTKRGFRPARQIVKKRRGKAKIF